MARKRASKRPSIPSIERSLKTITSFMASENRTFSETAKALGTSAEKLSKYMFSPRKTVKRAYKSYASIYEQTQKGMFQGFKVPKITTEIVPIAGQPREVTRIGGYYTYEYFKPKDPNMPANAVATKDRDSKGRPILYRTKTYHRAVQIAPEAQRRAGLYMQSIRSETKLPAVEMTLKWQVYTSRHNIPARMDAIREMYDGGEISRTQAMGFINYWHSVYSDMDYDYFESVWEDWFEDE